MPLVLTVDCSRKPPIAVTLVNFHATPPGPVVQRFNHLSWGCGMRIYQRGSHWWFDGVIDGSRKRFPLGDTVKPQKEAEAWLSRYVQENSALTIRSFITAYLHERKPHLSAKTLESYKDSLKAFESYFGVSRGINTITARELAAWAFTRLQAGLKPMSVNVGLRSVKAALNRALGWELIDKIPKIELVKTPKHHPRHLTEEQVMNILSHESNPEFRRMWGFMVWTAVRRGEALGLRWEDVHLADKPQALVTGKGDKQRVVPLLPPAVEALGRPGNTGPVFLVGHKDYVSHHFSLTAKAAGVPAKLHDLRHTGLTWMVSKGVPLKLVQEIAGHSSITTTMGYAKTFAGGAYDTLSQAFGFNQ